MPGASPSCASPSATARPSRSPTSTACPCRRSGACSYRAEPRHPRSRPGEGAGMTITDQTSRMSVEERLQRLEDVNEIQRLKSAYTLACDDNYNPDAICALFTDDGLWSMNVFGHHQGKNE